MKILAAMSGGVDSSVAAAMLVRDGHDVTGVHLRLTEQTPAVDGRVHGCCGVADADDARRVAQVLDIPERDHMRAVGDRVFKAGVLAFLERRP